MSLNRKSVKEKVVLLYESLFSKEPMEILSNKPDYWEEFFLLKPSSSSLQSLVRDYIKKEQKTNKKYQTINLLFSQCIAAVKDENQIRIANALLTLIVISRAILFKQQKPSQQYDRLDALIGTADLDVKIELLRLRLCEILFLECPIGLKSLVLDFLLILITWEIDINNNVLMQHLMSDHLFDAFISSLCNPHHRQALGCKSVLLLTIFVSFKKDQVNNPYVVKLSIVHKEVALNGFAHVICSALNDFNRIYGDNYQEPVSGGLFSSISSLMGNMFVADDESNLKSPKARPIKPRNCVLLAFYQAIHLNRNFISLLTNCSTDPSEDIVYKVDEKSNNSSSIHRVDSSSSVSNVPSNLLVTFLEFCSIVMLNTKDMSSTQTTRLCFIILTCISEDQCANAIMHDSNISFRVQLHRLPMRHRKVVDGTCRPSKSLSHSVLDLMIEFILSNLRKGLPVEHYSFTLGIIHRIICYQKRWKIRFNYPWTDLWSALITFVKYLTTHESELIKSKCEIFPLITDVIKILNLFITYGDDFLPSAQSYDQLYYEIIRMHIVFENLNSMAVRYLSSESSPFKSVAGRIISSLANIKAIINHFNPKIDSWKSRHDIETLTENDVLEIVKDNYDSLTLKLFEGLDSYENYSSDTEKETLFFKEVLEQVVCQYSETIKQQRQSNNQEFCGDHNLLISEIIATQNASTQMDESS